MGVSFQIGQKAGDILTLISGGIEIGGAGAGEIASLGIATPVAAGVAAHGATAVGMGLYHLTHGGIVYSAGDGNVESSGKGGNSSKKYDSQSNGYKSPKKKLSGKEGAKDIPDWARGNRPRINENGDKFARRILDEKYGKGNYKTSSHSEYSKIKKWGDRAFE